MGNNTHWNENCIGDQAGRTVIITGANSGIGFEAAKVLTDKGAQVIMACRSEDKAQHALERIKTANPSANISIAKLDLSELASVRHFAEEFNQNHTKLDLLINNAGVMTTPDMKTSDGFELQFGTNHLGHFALTGLLIEALTNTANARVVNLSSMAHRIGKIDFNNFRSEHGYNTYKAYGQSKLANLLFSYELQRRLQQAGSAVISTAAHPGSSATDLTRHSKVLNLFYTLKLAQSAAMGALPTLRAAIDPEAQGGEFYGPRRYFVGYPVIEKSTKRSYDEAVAARLWDVSEQMTGVKFLSH